MGTERKLKVAVVGAGFAGQAHMQGYKNSKDADLIAVCDVSEERAKEAAEKYGIPNVFTDYEQMLKMDELEAVSVCLPNFMHKPATVAALEAGKHVLCEKPLATNAKEAEEMVAAAEKSGKTLAMSLNFRYQGTALTAKKLIDEGKLGEIYYAKTGMLRNNSIPKGWFHVKSRSGGGPLLDLAAHVLDVTWWLMGRPEPVSASGVTFAKLGISGKGMGSWGVGYGDGPVDIEDLAVGLIRFKDGQTLTVEVSWALNGPPDQYCHIYGTEAGMTVFPGFAVHKDPKIDVKMEPDRDRIHEFVRNILDGTEPLGPGKDGVQIMRMLDAIYESAQTGKEAAI